MSEHSLGTLNTLEIKYVLSTPPLQYSPEAQVGSLHCGILFSSL